MFPLLAGLPLLTRRPKGSQIDRLNTYFEIFLIDHKIDPSPTLRTPAFAVAVEIGLGFSPGIKTSRKMWALAP